MARDVDQRPPFYLAIPVDDLDRAREFYCGLLGCATGRDDERWLDLDFLGHQVTLHLADGGTSASLSFLPMRGIVFPIKADIAAPAGRPKPRAAP